MTLRETSFQQVQYRKRHKLIQRLPLDVAACFFQCRRQLLPSLALRIACRRRFLLLVAALGSIAHRFVCKSFLRYSLAADTGVTLCPAHPCDFQHVGDHFLMCVVITLHRPSKACLQSTRRLLLKDIEAIASCKKQDISRCLMTCIVMAEGKAKLV